MAALGGRGDEGLEDLLAVALTDDAHAERGAEVDELVEEVGGLEALGDGEDAGELGRGPRTGEVPVAHMGEGQDDAATLEVLAQRRRQVGPHAGADLLSAGPGEREGLVEVAHVGAHAGA